MPSIIEIDHEIHDALDIAPENDDVAVVLAKSSLPDTNHKQDPLGHRGGPMERFSGRVALPTAGARASRKRQPGGFTSGRRRRRRC
jgi:hypothetical protein